MLFGELVGIPAVLVIAPVRIYRAQHAGIGRYLQLVLESMPASVAWFTSMLILNH
jgi:hypothetical protein